MMMVCVVYVYRQLSVVFVVFAGQPLPLALDLCLVLRQVVSFFSVLVCVGASASFAVNVSMHGLRAVWSVPRSLLEVTAVMNQML